MKPTRWHRGKKRGQPFRIAQPQLREVVNNFAENSSESSPFYSDLEPAVEWVRKNHPGIKVSVYVPTLPECATQRRNDNYQRMQVACRLLPLLDIPRHLLPQTVTLSDGSTVERPSLA